MNHETEFENKVNKLRISIGYIANKINLKDTDELIKALMIIIKEAKNDK